MMHGFSGYINNKGISEQSLRRPEALLMWYSGEIFDQSYELSSVKNGYILHQIHVINGAKSSHALSDLIEHVNDHHIGILN